MIILLYLFSLFLIITRDSLLNIVFSFHFFSLATTLFCLRIIPNENLCSLILIVFGTLSILMLVVIYMLHKENFNTQVSLLKFLKN